MTIKEATFVKKDGTKRTMRFVELTDLPEDFLKSKVKNNSKSPTLPQGYQVVWDVEKENFRILNLNTLIGEIKNSDSDYVLSETKS